MDARTRPKTNLVGVLFFLVGLSVGTIALTPNSSPIAHHASNQRLTPEQIEAESRQWAVEVWIVLRDGSTAPASGFVVSADGKVVTCQHVTEGQRSMMIRFADGKEFSAHLIKDEIQSDLALLQMENVQQRLPIAPLGNASEIEAGDTVYAIGSPKGSHWKFTSAQVVEVNSTCGIQDLKCIRLPPGTIAQGNSGGALINSNGQVVGVNRALQNQTGEGLSVPIDRVRILLFGAEPQP